MNIRSGAEGKTLRMKTFAGQNHMELSFHLPSKIKHKTRLFKVQSNEWD